MHPSHRPRNPADLVALGHDPALDRLLRACGADESCITGGASDYDRFAALAAALPLCVGHPLHRAVTSTLQAATGLTLPLCADTARIYWDAWVDRYWYGKDFYADSRLAVSREVPPVPADWLPAASLTGFPDPTDPSVWGESICDLRTWTAWLETAVGAEKTASESQAGAKAVLLTLPESFMFTRPDPYHAQQAVCRLAAGEVADGDVYLLTAQAVRVLGQLAAMQGRTLLLHGGKPAAVTALLSYLDGCRGLPANTVWLPHDPADAGAVSGLYASVRTGIALPSADAPDTVETRLTAYARVAPIGRAVLLTDGDMSALRPVLARILHDLAKISAPEGDCP